MTEVTMSFGGFEQEDFDLFAIPEFAPRMGEIRSRLRPKLIALGEMLREEIAVVAGEPIFLHAAAHMRRSVNPPSETWVAFGRSAKGYKRYVHFRAAVSDQGVRVTVFVEDDADDKPVLAGALREDAAGILARMGSSARVCWFTAPDPDGTGLNGTAITPAVLQTMGETLATRKLAKFQTGIPLGREPALVNDPARFRDAALHAIRQLTPLYHAAIPNAKG